MVKIMSDVKVDAERIKRLATVLNANTKFTKDAKENVESETENKLIYIKTSSEDATSIKGKVVDDSEIGDKKVLGYSGAADKIVYMRMREGGGGWHPLIKKVTATAAVQMLRLTGLNLVKGKTYRLVVCIKSAVATGVLYYLDYNGDTVAAHYGMNAIWRQYGTAVDTIHTTRASTDFINDNNTAAEFLFQVGDLVIDPDGYVYLVYHANGYISVLEIAIGSQQYNQAVTSITQIDWRADTAASIDVGSWMAVYETE